MYSVSLIIDIRNNITYIFGNSLLLACLLVTHSKMLEINEKLLKNKNITNI